MKNKNNLIRDCGIIFLSIIVAVILVKTGTLKNLLAVAGDFKALASFLAGIFFVSVFTVAPASVTLVELAQSSSIVFVAFFGGLGALVGDLIIFRFLRDSFSKSLLEKIRFKEESWLKSISRIKIMRVLMPFVGALIIISPFPDEIGLMMMGLANVRTIIFIPMVFLFNFIGILFIVEIFK